MLRYDSQTYELREIPDDLLSMWEATDNPKLAHFPPVPQKPSDDAIWSNGRWTMPIITIPESVSARQVRIWLIQHGISLAAVEAAIQTIQDITLKEITKVEWEYAPYIERNHPMLVPLAEALGLTQAQLDQAFIEAQNI